MEKTEFFPLSEQPGSVTQLNSELMHNMSQESEPVSSSKFGEILLQHKLFLENGGRGGSWQTMELAGLTLSVYTKSSSTVGKQASFLNSNLSLLSFIEMNLECCDFTNIYCPNGRFNRSNLSNSIFIDSVLINADFLGANLSGCDFSRAQMMNCSFIGANLSSCDFENCDLSNSNFLGATTSGSRFPGARLDNVIF